MVIIITRFLKVAKQAELIAVITTIIILIAHTNPKIINYHKIANINSHTTNEDLYWINHQQYMLILYLINPHTTNEDYMFILYLINPTSRYSLIL